MIHSESGLNTNGSVETSAGTTALGESQSERYSSECSVWKSDSEVRAWLFILSENSAICEPGASNNSKIRGYSVILKHQAGI